MGFVKFSYTNACFDMPMMDKFPGEWGCDGYHMYIPIDTYDDDVTEEIPDDIVLDESMEIRSLRARIDDDVVPMICFLFIALPMFLVIGGTVAYTVVDVAVESLWFFRLPITAVGIWILAALILKGLLYIAGELMGLF